MYIFRTNHPTYITANLSPYTTQNRRTELLARHSGSVLCLPHNPRPLPLTIKWPDLSHHPPHHRHRLDAREMASKFPGRDVRLRCCSPFVWFSKRNRGAATLAQPPYPAANTPCLNRVDNVGAGHSTCSSDRTAVSRSGPLGTVNMRVCGVMEQALEPFFAWIGTRWRSDCVGGDLISCPAFKRQGIQVHGFCSGAAGFLLAGSGCFG